MLRIPHMTEQPWTPLRDFSFVLGISGCTSGFVFKAGSPHSPTRSRAHWTTRSTSKCSSN